jgi:hypothetical protein
MRITEATIPRLRPAWAGLQASRAPLGEALADIEYPGLGQPDLRRDRIVRQAGLAQADDLPPALLLRGRRQLAHVQMLHAPNLGQSYLPSRSPKPDQ